MSLDPSASDRTTDPLGSTPKQAPAAHNTDARIFVRSEASDA
jgi:hypothetical protein